MPADLQVPAIFRFDELPNFVVTLPGTFFLLGIVDLSDEVRVQARIAFLPEKNAIGGKAVASRASGFLIILFN
jgi:hypothetical protein